jgi:hypothetical protein
MFTQRELVERNFSSVLLKTDFPNSGAGKNSFLPRQELTTESETPYPQTHHPPTSCDGKMQLN